LRLPLRPISVVLGIPRLSALTRLPRGISKGARFEVDITLGGYGQKALGRRLGYRVGPHLRPCFTRSAPRGYFKRYSRRNSTVA
jgi:hypothetical protein